MFRRFRFILILMLGLALSGCASLSYRTSTTNDAFGDSIADDLGEYDIGPFNNGNQCTVDFQRVRLKKDLKTAAFFIKIYFHGLAPVDIPAGTTMLMLVNGARTDLVGDGARSKAATEKYLDYTTEHHTNKDGKDVSEVVSHDKYRRAYDTDENYRVTLGLLKQLAVADKVDIKIKSDELNYETNFEPQVLTYIGQWIEDMQSGKIP